MTICFAAMPLFSTPEDSSRGQATNSHPWWKAAGALYMKLIARSLITSQSWKDVWLNVPRRGISKIHLHSCAWNMIAFHQHLWTHHQHLENRILIWSNKLPIVLALDLLHLSIDNLQCYSLVPSGCSGGYSAVCLHVSLYPPGCQRLVEWKVFLVRPQTVKRWSMFWAKQQRTYWLTCVHINIGVSV